MNRKFVSVLSVALIAAFSSGVSLAATATHSPRAASHAPKAHRVSMAEARRTALAKVAGAIKAEELEHEHGRWIYSFEIRPQGETRKLIREVNVDADTGRIVDVSTEAG